MDEYRWTGEHGVRHGKVPQLQRLTADLYVLTSLPPIDRTHTTDWGPQRQTRPRYPSTRDSNISLNEVKFGSDKTTLTPLSIPSSLCKWNAYWCAALQYSIYVYYLNTERHVLQAHSFLPCDCEAYARYCCRDSVRLSNACIVTKRKQLAKKVQLWLIGTRPRAIQSA